MSPPAFSPELCRVSAAKLASPKPKHPHRGCAAAIHLTVRHICRGDAGASERRPYQDSATDLHPALSSPSATPLRSGGYAARLSELTERRRAQRLRRKTRLMEGEARDEGARPRAWPRQMRRGGEAVLRSHRELYQIRRSMKNTLSPTRQRGHLNVTHVPFSPTAGVSSSRRSSPSVSSTTPVVGPCIWSASPGRIA